MLDFPKVVSLCGVYDQRTISDKAFALKTVNLSPSVNLLKFDNVIRSKMSTTLTWHHLDPLSLHMLE